ncbi:hypothetical protein H6F38_04575 [Paenibacillus sp. EKM208P]|nr:hypothetical protein H6F38_04575 [Paenibacillus sp. EKM208P]
MTYFAQYNSEYVIFAVSQSVEAPPGDSVIKVSGYGVLGSRYHPDTGEFEKLPVSQPESSVEDKLREEIAMLKQADLDNKEAIALLLTLIKPADA